MKRRGFMAGLVGAATIGSARAQQTATPEIGFLCSVSPGAYAPFVAAFRQGLSEGGYVDGQNVAIEYRWAEGHYDRLPELAADLVRRRVALIWQRVARRLHSRPRRRRPKSRLFSKPAAIRSRQGSSPASITRAAISPA
jgi:hypothetical protein